MLNGYIRLILSDMFPKMHWISLTVLLMALSGFWEVESAKDKVCRGTSTGFNHNAQNQYEDYKSRYTNCTYVDGNVEIVFIEEAWHDMSFLSDIREVTGYVLIVSLYADYAPLTSLRVIRGRSLFFWGEGYYGLWVGLNYKPADASGLKELRFTSLYEISRGDVFFHNNHQLCFENTINWNDILSGEGAKFHHHDDDEKVERRKCGECDPACDDGTGNRHCWGEGSNMCQKLTKENCSPQCEGRCYGTQPNQCCHPECVGGCTGPTNADCWACQNVKNDDKCERFCPPEKIYDPTLYKYVPNPHAKYTYGTLCRDECPQYLLADNGACVSSCGAERMAGPDRKCKECDGPCPKTCPGITGSDFVNHDNILNFTDCTVIDGNILLLQSTFDGDRFRNIPPMHPSNLSVFESVQEITGHLKIQGSHVDFVDLDMFKNLKVIHGREVDSTGASFQVFGTKLNYLKLTSMGENSIKNGMIFIHENPHLCFADTIDWDFIRADTKMILIVSENMPLDKCKSQNRICHPQCSDQGCWGMGDQECVSCANYHLDKTCLETCRPDLGIFHAGERECKPCNKECRGMCSGGGADECNDCKHVKDGPYCVEECPIEKYPDENGVCQKCHDNCEGGCTGPKNTVGKDACKSCNILQVGNDGNITRCLPKTTTQCEEGFYMGTTKKQQACMPCHPECKTCNGASLQFCLSCLHYSMEGKCVPNCTSTYFADDKNGMCVPCNTHCVTCQGKTASDCLRCKVYKVYHHYKQREENSKFNCTDRCPPAYPAYITEELEEGLRENVCVTDAIAAQKQGTGKNYVPLIIGLVVGAIVLIAVIISVIFYFRRQWARAEENKLRLTARMSGLEESEPLTPTDAKPDMAMLRLIKESELRRGNIIGSGAFGTVYKGVWIPEGENVKIPVAIKVLQEGNSPNQNKELLEEARIMASVEHPCCIRILAVCMTAQMMLITQLMPLGCLLDYVRKNRSNIGSKVLLNWCTQIAKGMSYLEERQIVHRDLAARNVLVQSPGQVKITDFGLAKLLDFDEEEFHASGGKMPIKWLALECIQHRIFTHKSDVWSFGVTMWELFTFGQRPYDSMRARDIPDLLEKGERLSQPSICTIDVYMIMIKCWMLDADSRPSFKELADEFAKMARDPGRYLVIQGDKLLRLPSHTYDTQDLVRNMSVNIDGPEKIIDAEEYLQPQQGATAAPQGVGPQPVQMNGKLDKVTEDSGYDNDHQSVHPSRENSRERDDSSGSHGGARREKKYSGLEAAMAAKNQRGAHRDNKGPPRDSVNSRYSSDPCRVLGDGDTFDGPDMPAPPTPVHPGLAEEGMAPPSFGAKMKMPIPVDEDDYLTPKSSNPAAYMDLVQDAVDYLAAEAESLDSKVPAGQPNYLDMSPSSQPSAIDNPEYFDNVRNNHIPTTNYSMPNHSDKQPLTLHSADEEVAQGRQGEPSGDYYNEFDHIKKPALAYSTPAVAFKKPRTESSV